MSGADSSNSWIRAKTVRIFSSSIPGNIYGNWDARSRYANDS
jgi:hypothetical protein